MNETIKRMKKHLGNVEKRYENVQAELEGQKVDHENDIKDLKMKLSAAQHDINKLSSDA
jgi:archaellum component FlaC